MLIKSHAGSWIGNFGLAGEIEKSWLERICDCGQIKLPKDFTYLVQPIFSAAVHP